MGCLARDVACTGDFRAVNVTVREPCLTVSARSCSVAECGPEGGFAWCVVQAGENGWAGKGDGSAQDVRS
jgi:hypothetical protein